MTTTYLIVAIEHEKPLPEDVTVSDVVADRVYGWLRAKGLAVDVRATRLTPGAIQKQAWEIGDGQPA